MLTYKMLLEKIAVKQGLHNKKYHFTRLEHKTFISDFTTPNFGEKKIDREKIVAAVQTVDPATGRVVMLAPDVGLR